ncbi:hypothetical protein B0J12DRAFT_723527 [Macrophomina phaseolina]|uniref:Uncharacterized protein n=1 Tax=Macrophomina phaseolina TaxID=35725 RepID=A0ABQ8GX09_9PEZI|nr:hypothetical protein B0J12DRAFT_723527 [Macrophomina phaseolina]
MQQKAVEIHGGEHPACGAMTTGFVFRVENPATVCRAIPDDRNHWGTWLGIHVFSFDNASVMGSVAYAAAVLWGIAIGGASHALGSFVLSRLCNVLVIGRRTREAWSGAKEPGEKGDLLILLSQDRWIRMKGLVDDLKAVTSGQWLRDPTNVESWVTAFATIIVYLDAALASNVTQAGKILLLALLIGSVGLLAIANASTDQLQMRGCVVKVQGERKAYDRRLDLIRELMDETEKHDWATRMGVYVPDAPQPDLQTDGHKRVEM